MYIYYYFFVLLLHFGLYDFDLSFFLTLRRMTGKDDDAHFTELQALESRLKDVSRTVLDQKVRKLPFRGVGRMTSDSLLLLLKMLSFSNILFHYCRRR